MIQATVEYTLVGVEEKHVQNYEISKSGRLARLTRILLIAAAAAGPSATGQTLQDETVQEEVMAVVRAFNDAFAENDPDRYFSYIAPDVVVITPSNPYRVEGIEDDREEFEWGLRTGRSRIGYFQELQPQVHVLGEAAVVTYYSRGSYGPEESVAYLKETDVLVRRNGEWKIVHIHVSGTVP